MSKVAVIFLVLFALVAVVNAEEKSKEGYKDLELPKFEKLKQKPKPSGLSVESSCTTRDGRITKEGDPEYGACLSDLRHGPNPQAIRPGTDPRNQGVNLKYDPNP